MNSPPAAAPRADSPSSFTFEELIRKERAWIDADARRGDASPGRNGFVVSKPGVAEEPWVCFTSRDTFGIALSGGGIRSATFNLGLLQAFERHGVLAHADYLSTVSGGGYIGGFLDAWQHHHPDSKDSFPVRHERDATGRGAPIDPREPPPLRQLREFSRFLMPRLGILHFETWSAIVTILGGVAPSLIAACAVLAFGVYVWLLTAFRLSDLSPGAGAITFGLLTLFVLLALEHYRHRVRQIRNAAMGAVTILSVITSLWVAALWFVVGSKNQMSAAAGDWIKTHVSLPSVGIFVPSTWLDGTIRWLEENFDVWSSAWLFRPLRDGAATNAEIGGAFAPALAWFGVVALLLFVRGICSRANQTHVNWSGAIDRVIVTCLTLGLGWSAMALLWAVCLWVRGRPDAVDQAAMSIGAGAATAGGLFAWLRDWLTKPSEETRATTLTKKIFEMLRPKIPQLLAAAAVLLLLAGVCLAIQVGFERGIFVGGMAATVAILLGTLVFLDPARVGMHDFYRARICRCFLGSARADLGAYDRDTIERPQDDLTLGQLQHKHPAEIRERRPLHLVCCTANNLSGDVLGSLYRGGRSAVLSPHGISLGNYAAPLDDLRLSSALTASAAAFNSQMGRFSMDLGPAVAFLMSALNLRLGLWVPHPLNPNRKDGLLRGLPFFYEMLGMTNCDLARTFEQTPSERGATIPAQKQYRAGRKMQRTWRHMAAPFGRQLDGARDTVNKVSRRFYDLHLSDGGHFENLALYELVRRHCRYIIVSDCGADPEVAFDDLAVALRTIREDFGVEIDLDVTPLRPGQNGRARQHAVVGTIHYDGLKGLDKGTLLYFKPTLTGDEPPDVLQYQTRNLAFPHESTGDQFYDEAQWESYRRLGEHAGNVVFRFVESYSGHRRTERSFVENIFLDANRQWHPAPERQHETFLALTERCTQMENDIRENAPAALRAEFFPEFAAACGAAKPAAAKPQDDVRTLYFLMQVGQMMEDVWVGAELDTYWSHPLNDGWMNYCHRWASTPSFRRWWPVLRPIYSIGFRDFVRERFDLGYNDAEPKVPLGARLVLTPHTNQTGLVWDYWRLRRASRAIAPHEKILEFRLQLEPTSRAVSLRDLAVGLLIYNEGPIRDVVTWRSDDLFVPPSLNGAGITARFLEAIIGHFAPSGERRLEVVFNRKTSKPDPANRLRQLNHLNFYKSRGFISERPTARDGTLRLVLPRGEPTDAALRARRQSEVTKAMLAQFIDRGRVAPDKTGESGPTAPK